MNTMVRRYLKILLSLMVVAGTIASAGCFFLISSILSVRPNSTDYSGWVAFMQPEGAINPKASTRVSAVVLQDQQEVSYSVITCGSGSWEGRLLIGGDARLSNPLISRNLASEIAANQLSSTTARVKTYRTDLEPYEVNLGDIQYIDFRVEELPSCAEEGAAIFPAFYGAGIRVSGIARRSFIRRRAAWPFTAPKYMQSLPLVGTFPGLYYDDKGPFTSLPATQKSYWIPLNTLFVVNGGEPTIGLTIEDSRPKSESADLSWAGRNPIAATSVLVHVEEYARLQRYLAIASIAFGILGSLLASMIFESFRNFPKKSNITINAETRTYVEDEEPRHLNAGKGGNRSNLAALIFGAIFWVWLILFRRLR